MKTVDIVKGLLEIAKEHEFTDGWCNECGDRCGQYEHTDDCKFVELTEAADEYLKLMEGTKK